MRKRLSLSLVSVCAVLVSLLLPGLAAAAPTPDLSAAALSQLRTTFFFAEGATTPPFDTWLLLFNPNASAATATVTFFTTGTPTTRTVSIAPNARASLFVNQILPNAAFGMRVDSSLPIAAERAMYFRQDGTAVVGIAAPSTTWLFGEGATAFPHETWFLMLNPSPNVTANTTLTFFLEGGGTRTFNLPVPPQSRRSIFANQIVPNAAFATRITSDQPIVAERSMFKTNTGGGHATQGATAPANAWFFSEGSTAQPFDTWFLIYNPNPTPIRILMRFFLERTGPGALLDFNVPANSRRSLFANQIQPGIAGLGATIVSEGGPFVAERSMFFANGQHGTLGATALSSTWFFAEGSTAAPFQEWILLVNPSGEADANATLTFFFPNGTSTARSFVVPGEGRLSIFTDLLLPQTAVSTRVTSDRPIMAERSMYFSGGNGGHNVAGIPAQ